jgi:hypothetical protein
MTISNMTFYERARKTLAVRYALPGYGMLTPYLKGLVQTLRIAEVVRYNTASVNMGCTVTKYDGKLFEVDDYALGIRKVLTCGWFMEIAGTEYMLELVQPGHPGFASRANFEVFKLQTDTWSVQFRLVQQQISATMWANGDLSRYMNQYALLGEFDPQGDMHDLENNAAMFTLLSADLYPVPVKAGV